MLSESVHYVPILLILHVIAVAVNFKPCGNWQAYATYAQPPLSPDAEDSVLLVMSKVCVRALCVLAAFGVGLVVVYVTSDNIYERYGGCSETLLNTTTASLAGGQTFEWIHSHSGASCCCFRAFRSARMLSALREQGRQVLVVTLCRCRSR